MRTQAPNHSVIETSHSNANPYQVGRNFRLHDMRYCYGVLKNKGFHAGGGTAGD